MGRILAFAAQASPFLLAGLALGGSMYRLVNHTFYASGKCKKVAVDNNLEKTLSPYLNSMVNKVADNFLSGKISPRDFAEIKFFLAETSEVYSRGSTKTRPCGFIVPLQSFVIKDPDDFKKISAARIISKKHYGRYSHRTQTFTKFCQSIPNKLLSQYGYYTRVATSRKLLGKHGCYVS
ncbi:hypothetical protein DPMN_062494 [Dreissena polymorpha]|uniref:Uncharacterized protein n=1 Tax=Dreissena polymorpha TaxID=45954 RepID=A0A9D4HJC6_DREPO|nr:hypothetical protein DPMN_062494 [Dreissena polymorpha]